MLSLLDGRWTRVAGEAATDRDGKGADASLGCKTGSCSARDGFSRAQQPSWLKYGSRWREPEARCSLQLGRLDTGRTRCLEACGPLLSSTFQPSELVVYAQESAVVAP